MSLLISGTGAICYSFVDGNIFRSGGWGHRIGDEGSGYWIGKSTVNIPLIGMAEELLVLPVTVALAYAST